VTERIAILGTGLIGGSIGLALRGRGDDVVVVGYDIDPAGLEGAVARGAIDEASESAAVAVAGADLVVLAMPVDRMEAVCRSIEGAVPPEAVVTDVGSSKSRIVGQGESSFGERFIGGHPMAGSERHGIDAADGDLFDGAWWILTPTHGTHSAPYRRVASLAAAVRARPIAIAPDVHDDLVARLSHVPQIAASALVDAAATAGDREALLGLAAGGFRDVTRIAASNPDLWVAILRSNSASVLEALRGLGRRLEAVAGMLEAERWSELRDFLDRARVARTELFRKPVYAGDPAALGFLIPDKPGVLAEVTTTAANLGVNIEDLKIVHSTEGGRGRLVLVVSGREAAERLMGELGALGYRAERIEIDD
jgi:prephenate dehydrogenase